MPERERRPDLDEGFSLYPMEGEEALERLLGTNDAADDEVIGERGTISSDCDGTQYGVRDRLPEFTSTQRARIIAALGVLPVGPSGSRGSGRLSTPPPSALLRSVTW